MWKIWPANRSSDVQPVAKGAPDPATAGTDAVVLDHAHRILTEHLPVLRAVAARVCRGNADEVAELVQDVFEKALRSIHTLNLKQNPRGWLVTILHNLHIDRCRQRARRFEHVGYDDVSLPAPESSPAPDWAALGIDDIRRAAAQLSPELRETYVLFAFEDRTYAEVAAALGVPTGTVGTRILRARARLREILAAELAARAT
jgi:RNA polymerase sigma-70 factor (ECF subfamily)